MFQRIFCPFVRANVTGEVTGEFRLFLSFYVGSTGEKALGYID
jgi:hypothetical protein